MRTDNFEIKECVIGNPQSTMTQRKEIRLKDRNGVILLRLEPEEFREVAKLCKDFFEMRYGCQYIPDSELLDELRVRGFKGVVTFPAKEVKL